MLKPAGYLYLLQKYQVERYIPHHVTSYIGTKNYERVAGRFGFKEQHFAAQYEPDDSLGGHLEFALKYEGTTINLICEILKKVPEQEVESYILSKQTGKYARRIWFIYESCLGKKLNSIPDLQMGNYVPLLDPDEYLTMTGRKVPRYRIEDNLFGSPQLAPMIRRTDLLNRYLAEDFTSKANKVLNDYPADLLARAIQYLYTKETKSSYAIEKEVPDSKKSERFVQILKNAGAKDYLEKKQLISLQNEVVDPRFIDKDYRKSQNYVGETLLDFSQKVHYISPKPNDVPQLMDFLKELRDRGIVSNSHPYALAVAVSYLFVFIHPFEDGNGRIHRFLLHDILNRFSFTPKGFIFPISATLLRQKEKYDHMLESVSEPLMSLINYDLDEDGQLTVREETAHLYRYLDLTVVLESMFEILTETIEKDLAEELAYLANFDINMEKLKAIVDMPNKQLNLFIRLCLQNGGKLSAGKRKASFPELTDAEILGLEQALSPSPPSRT